MPLGKLASHAKRESSKTSYFWTETKSNPLYFVLVSDSNSYSLNLQPEEFSEILFFVRVELEPYDRTTAKKYFVLTQSNISWLTSSACVFARFFWGMSLMPMLQSYVPTYWLSARAHSRTLLEQPHDWSVGRDDVIIALSGLEPTNPSLSR